MPQNLRWEGLRIPILFTRWLLAFVIGSAWRWEGVNCFWWIALFTNIFFPFPGMHHSNQLGILFFFFMFILVLFMHVIVGTCMPECLFGGRKATLRILWGSHSLFLHCVLWGTWPVNSWLVSPVSATHVIIGILGLPLRWRSPLHLALYWVLEIETSLQASVAVTFTHCALICWTFLI